MVSPWKRNLVGGRRPKIPWSTAETLAVMKGYEKYLKPKSFLRFNINIFHGLMLICYTLL